MASSSSSSRSKRSSVEQQRQLKHVSDTFKELTDVTVKVPRIEVDSKYLDAAHIASSLFTSLRPHEGLGQVRPGELNYRVLFLESATGTGKTTSFKKLLATTFADWEVIALTARRTMAGMLARTFGWASYLDGVNDDDDAYLSNGGFVVSIESLYKFWETIQHILCGGKKVLLLMDESESLFAQVFSTTVRHRMETVAILADLCQRSDFVLCADADMTDLSVTGMVKILGNFLVRSMLHYVNRYKRTRNALQFQDLSMARAYWLNLLDNNKSVYLVSGSRDQLLAMGPMLDERGFLDVTYMLYSDIIAMVSAHGLQQKKRLYAMYTSEQPAEVREDHIKNINALWAHLDFVGATSVITTGISYDAECGFFHHAAVSYLGMTMTPFLALQMTDRVRSIAPTDGAAMRDKHMPVHYSFYIPGGVAASDKLAKGKQLGDLTPDVVAKLEFRKLKEVQKRDSFALLPSIKSFLDACESDEPNTPGGAMLEDLGTAERLYVWLKRRTEMSSRYALSHSGIFWRYVLKRKNIVVRETWNRSVVSTTHQRLMQKLATGAGRSYSDHRFWEFYRQFVALRLRTNDANKWSSVLYSQMVHLFGESLDADAFETGVLVPAADSMLANVDASVPKLLYLGPRQRSVQLMMQYFLQRTWMLLGPKCVQGPDSHFKCLSYLPAFVASLLLGKALSWSKLERIVKATRLIDRALVYTEGPLEARVVASVYRESHEAMWALFVAQLCMLLVRYGNNMLGHKERPDLYVETARLQLTRMEHSSETRFESSNFTVAVAQLVNVLNVANHDAFTSAGFVIPEDGATYMQVVEIIEYALRTCGFEGIGFEFYGAGLGIGVHAASYIGMLKFHSPVLCVAEAYVPVMVMHELGLIRPFTEYERASNGEGGDSHRIPNTLRAVMGACHDTVPLNSRLEHDAAWMLHTFARDR